MTDTLNERTDKLLELNGLLETKAVSRETFLKGSGALVVGFSLAGAAVAGKADAATGKAAATSFAAPDATVVDSWIAIHPDNTATVLHGKVELGQGSPTGLLMIAAEELDLGMDQIRHVLVDTGTTPDQGFTAGSTSISGGGPQVRNAAASARQALLAAASQQLGVPVSQLTVNRGVVSGGGKTVTYGALLGNKTFNAKITGTAPTKPISQYKVVGSRQQRVDIPDKVSGKYTYVHNVRIPGMLHGRVVRPKGQGEYGKPVRPISVDEKSIKNIKGAQIVRNGDFLGVVAPTEFAAIQAAQQLKVKWEESATLPGHASIGSAFRGTKTTDRTLVNTGDVDGSFAKAAKTVTASFVAPFQSHGMIGPSAAIADYKSDGMTLFSATQLPYPTRGNVAKSVGLDPNAVRLIRVEGSGCYGHSAYDDATHAAAIMSKAVGAPVRVQFMRWDEHGWDNYGPGQLTDIRAGIDANGKIVAYDYTSWQPGWMSVETAEEQIGKTVPVASGNADRENAGNQYAIVNKRVTGKSIPNVNGGVPKAVWLRAPGAPQALHASEQVIDQLAYAAGMDAIAFRMANITEDRWKGVIDAAAKAAKWQSRPINSQKQSGTVLKGRGIAIGGFASTFAAVIAEIEVNTKTGKIRIDHLYAAQDAGLAISPSLIEQQIEGCLIQGASRALLEEVTFSKKRVTSLDWASYPILRFKDAPAVTAIVVNRPDLKSSGSGEPTTAPVPAAVANALFDATGVRLNTYPLTAARVKAALAAAKK